ncbi:MAG: cytochrome-c peroxidase [Pseudomonadales bacterium]|nr:cytochrome-c peroxidase [Pseudomonadales bacterium]MCP5195101.1 cytochrome-c peroxidase [Pseudomonadales bacterium]
MRILKPIQLTTLALLASYPLVSFSQDPLLDQARALFKPIPETAPPLSGETPTAAMVELGKTLYFDPRLSESHNISCNTCHQIGLGGVDMLPTSIGHNWQKGGRNAPTVLNAVFNTAQFWDGRAADLSEQAVGPIQNPIEMAISPEHAVGMLVGIAGYQPMFAAAFPGNPDLVTLANVGAAIAAFEATLLTPNAPFDRYLRGDENALSNEQKAGLKLFVDKGCAACHNGVNVGGGMYAPFGVVEKPGADFLPPADKGRFQVTSTTSDEYVFKVPTLRNIELTPPYFHSGKSWDLKQAIAVMATSQLGQELEEEEVASIEAFLLALTGEQPQVTYPILPPSSVNTPRPVF